MNDANAFDLIISGDANLFAIVALSLEVTLLATVVAALAGLPLGAFVALTRFAGGRCPSILVWVLHAAKNIVPHKGYWIYILSLLPNKRVI